MKKLVRLLEIADTFRKPVRYGNFRRRDGFCYLAEYETPEEAEDPADEDFDRVNPHSVVTIEGSPMVHLTNRIILIVNPSETKK